MVKKLIPKKVPKTDASDTPITDQFEIVMVRLISSSSTLTVAEGSKQSDHFSMNFTVRMHEGVKQNVVLVNVGCTTTLSPDDTPVDQGTHAAAVFQVVFKAKSEFPALDDDNKKQLVKSGAIIAWPYLRSFLQSNLSLMGRPPFVLPLFHPVQHGASVGRVSETDLIQEKKRVTRKKRGLKKK